SITSRPDAKPPRRAWFRRCARRSATGCGGAPQSPCTNASPPGQRRGGALPKSAPSKPPPLALRLPHRGDVHESWPGVSHRPGSTRHHEPREAGMKKVVGLALTLLLALTVASAWAGDAKGKIMTIDVTERVIILDDGSKLWIAEGLPIEELKEGQNVKASF